MGNEKEADVEKSYSIQETVAKLRRLADMLEAGKAFRIQVAGERIRVPRDATVEIEFEREGQNEEIEIDLKWKGKE